MNVPTLHALRCRPAGIDREAGSATVFVAITVLGLLILCGLVVDGGAKLRAVQQADRVATEAARAAGQAADPAALAAGDARVDRQAAVNAANGFLAAAQATGTGSISADGTAVEVTVTTTAPTVFLGLIGVSSFTVTGHGKAVLVHGVTGGGT
jgi:Tfp pilus assembly protein PilX